MDSAVAGSAEGRRRRVAALAAYVAGSFEAARVVEAPFYHLEFDRVFPYDIYAEMLRLMPETSDYRSMHGRSRSLHPVGGAPTRVKIDLFSEYIRNLPAHKLELWDVVGRALCSARVRDALVDKLAPALEKRFGAGFRSVALYPIPILTRDVPGYLINPHTDIHWKGITVQLYLPEDASNTDVGTIFHEVLPDGSLKKASQMRFAPNSGYAFAVSDDSWHSADKVHDRIRTRDSILLTYFVDRGIVRLLRNRGKRIGNFILNELRQRF